MEFFNKASAIRLKSHLDKYLTADDDHATVRQSRNGSSKKARWTVEFVEGNPHVIRLKSCHGGYLQASEDALMLGLTGKKVLQSDPGAKKDGLVEWEPIKEGFRVKLRTKGGKFLRANGATPPWRNSVTHDLPHRTATQDWIMWEVDVVDISALADQYLPSNASSFSSMNDDCSVTDSPSVQSSERKWNSSEAAEKRWPSIVPDRSARGSERKQSSMNDDCSVTDSPPVQSSERKWNSAEAAEKRWPSIVPDRSGHGSERKQGGMEFFDKAKSVRLRGHLGKYLVADDDEETVRQSRNGSSHRARWMVEFVDGKCNTIRLKSYHGCYLTASRESFLLGMTGKKVTQTRVEKLTDTSIEWEPVKEGLHVKLMTKEGKFLRANGGTQPWKNSVTHDVPHRTATQSWVLWGVDIMDIAISESDMDSGSLSPATSFNSLADDFTGSPDTGSPVGGGGYRNSRKMSGFGPSDEFPGSPEPGSPISMKSGKVSRFGESGTESSKVMMYSKLSMNTSTNQVSGMDFFKRAKTVRLKSHHDKFLTADTDQESVLQDRSGTSRYCRWTVEFVEGVENVLRLKSCFGNYLTATDEEHLLGVTGRKVIQSMPRKLDSSIEWEPIRDGMQVKLKTRYGNFLRANGGLPPWRNSITHDIPHRHHDWILWVVDVIEIRPESPPKVTRSESLDDDDLSSSSFRLNFPRKQPSGSFGGSPMKSEGRLIYYHVADDDGNVNEAIEGKSFQFKGYGLEDLVMKLEEETGLEDIIVCSRNRVNGKLYPLRLALPPNNATMNVVVIPSTSSAAEEFMPPAPSS